MIIPNLMVTDMVRSIAFYRDKLGLTLSMTVASDQSFKQGGESVEDPVFAILEWDGAQLMLQTVENLAQEIPDFDPAQRPAPGGTIYFRGFAPESAMERLSPGNIVKGPAPTWYGMRELYLRDPDGHILCLGVPEGEAPAA